MLLYLSPFCQAFVAKIRFEFSFLSYNHRLNHQTYGRLYRGLMIRGQLPYKNHNQLMEITTIRRISDTITNPVTANAV